MQQFGRVIQLIIGSAAESIIIDGGLTISFDLTKTITAEPNEATISIINLSQSTRNLITDKKYNRILLNAGLGNDIRTLFVGYIDEVENIKESVDITTKMTCGDGSKDYRESRTAVTVNKGQTDKDIVKQALKDMPDTGEGIQEFKKEQKLLRGKTMVGNTRDVLKTVAKNQDADWSVQDGKLLLLPKTSALANNEGFLIQEGTGMIGSPQKTSDGLEVGCQLNNALRVGQLCRISSKIRENSGDFKITKLQIRGSNKGSDFLNVLTLQNGQFNEVKK